MMRYTTAVYGTCVFGMLLVAGCAQREVEENAPVLADPGDGSTRTDAELAEALVRNTRLTEALQRARGDCVAAQEARVAAESALEEKARVATELVEKNRVLQEQNVDFEMAYRPLKEQIEKLRDQIKAKETQLAAVKQELNDRTRTIQELTEKHGNVVAALKEQAAEARAQAGSFKLRDATWTGAIDATTDHWLGGCQAWVG